MHRGLPQARAFTAKAACCSACFLLTFLPAIAFAGTYSGGSGTEAEPFRISSVPDWQELMTTPADWASHFVLTADIDLNDVPITPIGNDPNNFTGVFDGNDYVIRNADVNMPASYYVALFGCLGTDGQIKNLGVEDISIFGGYYVGGLVGCNEGTISNCYSSGSASIGACWVGGLAGTNSGTIDTCCSTGSVSGDDFVGGLVGGQNDGLISNCYSSGSVSGAGYDCGGLVGANWLGAISNSYSTGSVTGNDNLGGLVGFNSGTISNCYSSGRVSGTGNVGGVVGSNFGTISNCYSAGSVTGTGVYVGGLVGSNHSGGPITNCYSTGSVGGNYYVGGLVGRNADARFGGGPITNCYSSGSVAGNYSVGGLVGNKDSHGTCKSSFWDVNTSGWTTSAGGTAKTTAEMKTQSTFTSAGWDFIEVWDIGENQTYPFLRTYLAGDINHDGVVDFRDITHLAADWLGGVE